MTGATLLRLYPRAWRTRYGDEFLELVGDDRLGWWQVVDIVCGAIDARVTRPAHLEAMATDGPRTRMGGHVTSILRRGCVRADARAGREMVIGSLITAIGALGLAALGGAMRRRGFVWSGDFLRNYAVTACVLVGSLVWALQGQSRVSRTVLIAGLLAFVAVVTFVAMVI
jgi:hypothetical protein